MCHRVVIILALGIALSLEFNPSPTPAEQEQKLYAGIDYAPNEVVVTFRPEFMPAKTNVKLDTPAFGVAMLDDALAQHDPVRLSKLIPTYNALTTEPGAFLERTFLVHYHGTTDAQDLVIELSAMPYFEKVELNELMDITTHGTSRLEPGDTTEFADQWYLDNTDSGDKSDIDAPEAWAIEEGTPDYTVGVFDEGTMLDTCTSNNAWGLHSDFAYHWKFGEDLGALFVLNAFDQNGSDDDLDGVVDNIIGYTCLVAARARIMTRRSSGWVCRTAGSGAPRILRLGPPWTGVPTESASAASSLASWTGSNHSRSIPNTRISLALLITRGYTTFGLTTYPRGGSKTPKR